MNFRQISQRIVGAGQRLAREMPSGRGRLIGATMGAVLCLLAIGGSQTAQAQYYRYYYPRGTYYYSYQPTYPHYYSQSTYRPYYGGSRFYDRGYSSRYRPSYSGSFGQTPSYSGGGSRGFTPPLPSPSQLRSRRRR